MDSIRSLPIHVAPTTDRKAEPGRFENALRGAAHGLAQSAAFAAPFVPGGPILAGAIRGAVTQPASSLGPTTVGSGYGDALGVTGDLDSKQLIALQMQMQQENREFTTVSNVMKVRHDTAKAAIQNIH